MIVRRRTLSHICCAALVFFVAVAAHAEPSFSVNGRYTAQRKPRITVYDFQDTNSEAQSMRYGSSVQAMLVTFLKRKSQFVVVERQKLGDVLAEWQRNQRGMTNLQTADPNARELLEKLDAIVLGNVTLLPEMVEAKTVEKKDDGKPGAEGRPTRRISGPRIEIDAKLLSRADGRIIAAAQRSGPVGCLRSIVERLGIALEQEFLRPYYGRLKFNLSDPENVQIFLTPILLDSALDEEKPPVERSTTVNIGSDKDLIEPWTTDPTSYSIENLLSGWYSMRLERPGYEGLKTESPHWEARDVEGETKVFDRESGGPLAGADPKQKRFVVHVDPLAAETVDGDSMDLHFRKKGGSLAPRIKRQYLDEDFDQKPKRVVLIGRKGLEINQISRPSEFAEDESCDLFDEQPPRRADYGPTYVATGQTFDFSTYKGGDLIVEDYKGGVLPAGDYSMTLWEPRYQLHTGDVTVRDHDQDKATHSSLLRETLGLTLGTTGPRPASKVILEGKDTKHRIELPLDFSDLREQSNLPVDIYTASTTSPGLGAWRRSVELVPKVAAPPIYDPQSKDSPPLKSSAQGKEDGARPPTLHVKTRFGLGGRLSALSVTPDPAMADLFIDRDITRILDVLLERKEDPEEKDGFWREVGVAVIQGVAEGVTTGVIGGPDAIRLSGPPPTAPPASQTRTSAPATAATEPRPKPKPGPEPLPRDPDVLRFLLASHLRDIDLLVLDDRDMASLLKRTDTAAIVKSYIESGGSLFAFTAETGDYSQIVGAPFTIESKGRESNRFEIASGEVSGLALQLDKRKVKVKSDRIVPEVKGLGKPGTWRVLAFTSGRKDPRIVERGGRDQGGYVALWCERPDVFRGRRGGTVLEVEGVRAKTEKYVFDWARVMMFRRYDSNQQRAVVSPTP
ncbi:MAG TPA: CsgG/HfaB family protein [Thermoanaerobaculia bacterium]|jgi:curli biogenesis system outer membrane secretion channel CsgG|nr:CsgG/HfaB family protein [Thermoanaerobaculia bacterium]